MKNKWILNQKDLSLALIQQETVAEFLQFYYHQTKKNWPALSYLWLAREMGVSKSLVLGIFNGKKKVTSKTLPPLLKTLELPKILEEYLELLVFHESLPMGSVGPKKKEGSLMNLRETFMDSFDDSLNLEASISDPDFAILYAALGDQETGSSIEEITHKISWPEERIRFLLNELQLKKFVRLTQKNNWKGTKKFISTVAKHRHGWLPKLFLSTLKRHQKLAEDDFSAKNHLSLTYTFCIHDKDFEALNNELKKQMNKMMEKYHDGKGDKIMSLILGTHKN